MNILISGGTGLVGKALGQALVAQGHSLYVLTRDPQRSSTHTPYPHIPVKWDSEKPEISESIMSHVHGIINLAGRGVADQRWTRSFKKELYNSRIIGTRYLIQKANEHKNHIKFFISTSAVGYYGATGTQPADEDTPCPAAPPSSQSTGTCPGPDGSAKLFLARLCLDWEQPVLQDLHPSIRSVIFRVGVVLSEKGGALSKMLPPIQQGYGGAIGSGQQKVPWIDIDDLVSLYEQAVTLPWKGVFNGVAPEIVSQQQITLGIAQAIGRRPGPRVPGFAVRLAVGEFAQSLLENQSLSCQKLIDQGFDYKHPTLMSSLSSRFQPMRAAECRHDFEQWVPHKKEEIFPFFSQAQNLEKITPPFLNFKILSVPDKPVHQDMIIKYNIKINGLPFQWVTKITEWNPPHLFVDNQEKGPYSKWHHTHRFHDLGGGTLLTDRVFSLVPMGRLGLWVAGWKVYSDVQKIFAYRRRVISEMFGSAAIKP